jgi:O-methyltransferase involved in polyketide biosynthesis
MPELTTVSETLYVPLLGRIYASTHCPDILYDKMALNIMKQFPEKTTDMSGQTEYTLIASAVRSKNVDYYVQAFLSRHQNGVIVNVGCGLESLYDRNDNGKAQWFELDFPDVLKLRSEFFPENERDRYLPYSMFDYAWIDEVKAAAREPVLIVAAGLFYYFKEEQVIDFIEYLAGFDQVQLVFDAVSSSGIRGSRHYMKKMGRQDAEMLFSVDSAKALAAKITAGASVVEERKFYSLTDLRSKISPATKLKMRFSDAFKMVKMVHLRIG